MTERLALGLLMALEAIFAEEVSPNYAMLPRFSALKTFQLSEELEWGKSLNPRNIFKSQTSRRN